MAIYFNETRETINLLRRVVDKLDNSNGCISAEELWDGVQCVPADVRSPDPTVARQCMRQMESVLDVLQSFMSTLVSAYKAHTSTTRGRAHVPQLTLSSLPNELVLETIDLLRRVVDKLDEYDGCIGAEELWDSIVCVPANARSPDLTVARQGIRLTSRLVSTYKAHIHTTRSRAHIPQLTIESLPTEIIHHIVNDALEYRKPHYWLFAFDYRQPRWLIRYSHVSSKIRNTILDSPSLWASVQLTVDIPLWLIKTIIRRSAALKLTVFMDDSSFSRRSLRSDSFVSKLSAVFEHQHRWREATFTITDDLSRLIREQFPRANLASVRVLRVNKLRINFIEKWDIPRLEKLEWGSNDSLLPSSDMATHTCSLSLGDVRAQDVMSVAAFMNNATGLRTLNLGLRLDDDSGLAELPEIRLSCLEHLKVTVWNNSRTGTTARFLKAILCPGLKHFHLWLLTFEDYVALTEDMRGRYPMLTFFQLSLGDVFRTRVVAVFDELLSSLPSTIQKFQLGGTINMKFDGSRTDGSTPNNFCASFPNLKVLDLSECDAREENFYANLSNTLKRSHVTLNHFQPCLSTNAKEEGAMMTLRRAGVLVDLSPTS